MQRELNPHLFGAPDKSDTLIADLDFPRGNDNVEGINLALIRGVERQVQELRNQIKTLEARSAEAQTQVGEYTKLNTLRLDRAAQAMARIEQHLFKSVQDLNEKYAGVAGRLNERKVSETKIEELIDRHNQLVQNFDTRLKQMQKQQADREMQFLKAVAALEEARAEIARMKKHGYSSVE